jgi:CelD/BcsL family acetyltransferase involved in cellulose biosynthesis
MRADLLPTADLEPRDLAAWQELADAAVSPNPFLDPSFVLAAARGLGVRDVGLLVVRNDREWLAALPVRNVLSWRAVPGRCLASWVHLYCFLGTPIVSPIDPEAALTLLFRRGLSERASMALDLIDDGGPLAEPLAEALGPTSRTVVIEQFERASLHRRPAGDYLEQAMTSHHRRELRRMYRRLGDAAGPLAVVDRSDDPSAYDEFLRVEAAGWKGRRGTALGSHAGHAAFFREMCRGFAARGKLQLLCLQTDDRVVAAACNLIAGDVTFCFKVGFDEEFARFSPGIHLQAAYIERFHDAGTAWADSCAVPFNAMINRLWQGRRRLQSVVPCRRGISGALPYARWEAAAATMLPARAALVRRLRQRVPRH